MHAATGTEDTSRCGIAAYQHRSLSCCDGYQTGITSCPQRCIHHSPLAARTSSMRYLVFPDTSAIAGTCSCPLRQKKTIYRVRSSLLLFVHLCLVHTMLRRLRSLYTLTVVFLSACSVRVCLVRNTRPWYALRANGDQTSHGEYMENT
jgi:hypothetical protein